MVLAVGSSLVFHRGMAVGLPLLDLVMDSSLVFYGDVAVGLLVLVPWYCCMVHLHRGFLGLSLSYDDMA